MAATRTFDRLPSPRVIALAMFAAGAAAGILAVSVPVPAMARELVFKSSEAALHQGLAAVKSGNPDIAVPALEAAIAAGGRTGFLAQFYLARVFADNGHAMTDHAKAYMLYQRIADDHADIDPDDDTRTPFVSKALIALAQYLRSGVGEIGLKPNQARAAQYMHHAATVFSDDDAQFELAKMFLTGDGVEPDERRAVHWLSTLSQRGHPGAQALLADLHWRGRHVARDPKRALALITIAVENAPLAERIWIEDIYHNIFCGIPDGQRAAASGVVADWRHRYGRPADEQVRFGIASMLPAANRACRDGRAVLPVRRESKAAGDAVQARSPSLLGVMDVNERPRGQ